MVFSGDKHPGGERKAVEEDMERLKPLHNFDLPCLKWGNQKLLRCMKVDSKGDVSVIDRRISSESGGGSGSEIAARQRETKFERRFRSSGGRKFSLKENAGDGEIKATREKLMFDFQTEVGKMKDAILRGSMAVSVPAPAPLPASATTSSSPPERPWNLRTRRGACKAPPSLSNGNGDSRKPNISPARNQRNSPAAAATSGEKRNRPKFSVSLSRRELEEDFTAMAGRLLPRKPKKRPRVVQKQLDTLFPGLWLTEITADLYKVPDDTDSGKR